MELLVHLFSKDNTEEKSKKLNKWGPETRWSNHEQFEYSLIGNGKNELVIVAIIWDDLWLEVKC